MIDYIKYTVDGATYSLVDNGDGTWNKTANAPAVAGNYALLFEISENGIVTYIDSSDSRYETFLQVIESAERKVFLIQMLPEFMRDVLEFNAIFDAEDLELDELYADVDRARNDMFISSASHDAILRIENFLRIKGQGTLAQRKSYLISLFQRGKKLNEGKIKEVVNTITGSDCIVTFYGFGELGNPDPGYGLLRVQVLSPDNSKDYRYEDIARALQPLVPSHIKMIVIKYFATWADVHGNYGDWAAIAAAVSWQAIKDYISP